MSRLLKEYDFSTSKVERTGSGNARVRMFCPVCFKWRNFVLVREFYAKGIWNGAYDCETCSKGGS